MKLGVVSPWREVPDNIPKTPYYASGIVPSQESCVSALFLQEPLEVAEIGIPPI